VRKLIHSDRGFTLIELMIVTSIIGLLVCMGLLILGLTPTRYANEGAAIGAVRTLVTAERMYWTLDGEGNYGNLGDLAAAGMIDEPLSSGTRRGYVFAVVGQGQGFTVTATPLSNRQGTRSFFADESGVIRGRVGPGASSDDPPIGTPNP